jgi:hypothetical protein
MEALGWLTLAALLLLLVPVFLCMPLTPDASFYDLCGRYMLRGGVLERDLLYPAPPGMPWALAAVRATLGGSSIAARAADLAVVTSIIALLAGWLRRSGLSRAACLGIALLLAAFYLTTTEWEQVIPDTWMLLPALGALALRRRQVAALTSASRSGRQAAAWALVEGLLWGAGCLFKPFIALPGLLAWLASAVVVRRAEPMSSRRLIADAVGLLAGGLLMGALWQLWLVSQGSWHTLWHNFADFSGDYYAISPGYLQRLPRVFLLLFPWGLLHLAAVPVAIVALARSLLGRGPLSEACGAESLLAGFYLGWLVQGNFLQSQFPYHLLPTVFLAVALLAGWLLRRSWRRWGWLALAGFGLLAVALQPAVRPGRLALWADCWRRGATPEMKDRLHLWHTSPTWVDLARVADYLRQEQAGDRDVLCLDLSTTVLQNELGIRPPTRHIYPSTNMTFFVKHRDGIREELRAGPQRWVVIDLASVWPEVDLPDSEKLAALGLPPELAQRWPYSEPVVFRAGRYWVLQK